MKEKTNHTQTHERWLSNLRSLRLTRLSGKWYFAYWNISHMISVVQAEWSFHSFAATKCQTSAERKKEINILRRQTHTIRSVLHALAHDNGSSTDSYTNTLCSIVQMVHIFDSKRVYIQSTISNGLYVALIKYNRSNHFTKRVLRTHVKYCIPHAHAHTHTRAQDDGVSWELLCNGFGKHTNQRKKNRNWSERNGFACLCASQWVRVRFSVERCRIVLSFFRT